MRVGLAVVTAALAGSIAAFARAQQGPSVPDHDRAVDSALRQLFDEVGRLRLTTGHTLAAVLARSADDERAMRLAIVQRHQAWQANRLFGGEVEVDTWLPISTLNDVLARVLQHRLGRADQAPSPFSVTWARSSSPAVLASGRYWPAVAMENAPVGWRDCSRWQVAMAKAAAVADARGALLGRIAYWRMDGGEELGFLMRRHSGLRVSLVRLLGRVPAGEPVLEPTGVCSVKVLLGRAQAAELLREVAAVVGKEVREVSGVEPEASDAIVSAEGFAVAPPIATPYVPPRRRGHEVVVPDWADRFLAVQGSGRAPADVLDPVDRQLWAERAARIDASRQLWIQIEELPLPSGGTVRARLSNDRQAARALAGLDRFITAGRASIDDDDGATTVSVGIHLRIVWRMLNSIEPAP